MNSAPPKLSIGLRAQKGGAVVVALRLDQGQPEMLLSTFLVIEPEPYRAAAELTRDEAAAAVAEGRRCQDQLVAAGLRAVAEQVGQPATAGLLINRAGWVTNLLDYSREWAEHIPVAENLGLRDALRFACRDCGIEVVELDEKSLAEKLAESEERLQTLGAAAGKPWRREQKLACLAALHRL